MSNSINHKARAAALREGAAAIVSENDRMLWATKPGKHWAADLLIGMAETSDAVAELGALPVPAGPEPLPLSVEQERKIRSLDLLALMDDQVAPVVSGHLAALLGEIDRLRVERHSTNEALSDAAEALRRQRDRISELEALTPAAIQTCRKCGAGYTYGEACNTCIFQEQMAAELDGITRAIVPVQALREDEDPARCLKAHPFSPRDGWRMVCSNCDHNKDADCHDPGGVK